MPESYFSLSNEDKGALVRQRAPVLDMPPFLIEKDIWVCWALEHLFKMPDALPMAFKGGTSLSKVFSAIDRFSEDIDITIDYRGFGETLTGDETRGAIDRMSEKLKASVLNYTAEKIKPYFEKILTKQFGAKNCRVELSDNGEKLYVHYPSVLAEDKSDYLASSVLIEFGGRNITEPNEKVVVRPFIASVATDYSFPEAKVTVLALTRTYWEKATLIHVETNRPTARASAERMSRHWYDIFKLSKDLAAFQTSEAHVVLGSVVEHKKVFFYYGYANYDACLAGGLRLVPEEELREALEQDFAAMVAAGMFYSDPPTFAEILARLKEVENALNASISGHFKSATK